MPDDNQGSPELELIDIYERPDKIYTRSFTGYFRNLRMLGGGFLFLLFFGTAWVNLGGQQAVLFDLPARKFHIFGATFWPQDFILLSWLLIIAAFALFAITVFAGRVWCGYTCPQSVFTWVFMWAEKVTEGDRNKRMKGDKGSISVDLFMRKLAKHGIWTAVSLATAITFVGYFTPIRELVPDIFSWDIGSWSLFWIGFFALATYGNAGFLREMVCLHMCPYARFQSVMFDNNTLVVAYDHNRGESRGPRKKSVDPKEKGLGDCIDCSVCVQVCPTGIDIRNGLQYSCITCAACIDACDTIMDKMGYEKGLIRYTTENELNGTKTHLVRPRMVGYAAALVIMFGMFFYSLETRSSFELDILRDRNQLYRTNANGDIENVYTLKLVNKDETPHQMTVQVSGIEGLKANSAMTFTVGSGEVASHIVRLALPAGADTKGNKEIEFTISAEDESLPETTTSSRFITPIK
ncbi:cytochrome c oxidase accessory protein CcoG [Endozoicomonas sp. OPT23]|uniref:cytochrome c oxidase accessory protein CcoG n=1 Tax=Endozoicomonas sp. OPT23 TaxID=2072845 RepID=UPI00129B19EC|nr:cytochrome c oxidase accessory protein CcoG [Endozoicomonas sp. OPT23]MRI35413.1 cytochrome c oxidase accessory protein CcoG [Endozoicomonas sp. OPT23]